MGKGGTQGREGGGGRGKRWMKGDRMSLSLTCGPGGPSLCPSPGGQGHAVWPKHPPPRERRAGKQRAGRERANARLKGGRGEGGCGRELEQ